MIVGFLVSGYDYSRAKGFYLATDRESMPFVEALKKLPEEYMWFVFVFVGMVLVVECVISVCGLVYRLYKNNS